MSLFLKRVKEQRANKRLPNPAENIMWMDRTITYLFNLDPAGLLKIYIGDRSDHYFTNNFDPPKHIGDRSDHNFTV